MVQSIEHVAVEKIIGPANLYRVGHTTDSAGLWYDEKGVETGLIHTVPGAVAANLPMGPHPIFRSEGKKWISATDSLDNLRHWFSESDMDCLFERNYVVQRFTVSEYRRFVFASYSHEVFCQEHVLSSCVISHVEKKP